MVTKLVLQTQQAQYLHRILTKTKIERVITLDLRTKYQLPMVKIYNLCLIYLLIGRHKNKKARNQSAFGIQQDKIRKIFLLIEHLVCTTKIKHHGIRSHKYQRIRKDQHKGNKI